METLLVETRASSSSSRRRTALVLACALCGLILGCVPAALRRRDAPRLQAWEFAELPLDGRWDAITDLWERPLCGNFCGSMWRAALAERRSRDTASTHAFAAPPRAPTRVAHTRRATADPRRPATGATAAS